MIRARQWMLVGIGVWSGTMGVAWTHPGPDPVSSWVFEERFVEGGRLVAQQGPDVPLTGDYSVGDSPLGPHFDFWGSKQAMILGEGALSGESYLPAETLTVTAWVTVGQPREWGGILGAIQDNGDHEKGWILGYDQSHFYFGLASRGADDGDGQMTYLKGKTPYREDRFYQVTATYDGKAMRLYVNGALDAEDTDSQSGPILYPETFRYGLGGYVDQNENHPHVGSIRSIAVYDLAAKPEWIAAQYGGAVPEGGPAPAVTRSHGFVVDPYLQFVTRNSIVVKWETGTPARGRVQFGETADFDREAMETEPSLHHEVTLTGLEPEKQYFYRVWPETKRTLRPSDVLTFQTANRKNTPYAFAILSDTQSNPSVAGTIAAHAWGQRPNFCIHAGDLVGTGRNKAHWVDQFFPSLHPLISRVAFMPVLGNHEQNAQHYYDYMALPAPEYYYTYTYGNAQFFMVDSNKKLGPESEQYRWLDQALAASDAEWKFVCHHHPPYSSDENDYGDLWAGTSTRGDLKARQLVPLYEKHGVDIVWNGHIHSYERTWPIRGNRVVDGQAVRGPVYMIVGGGGGGLETPGPTRPFFMNTVRYGHHYCMVAVNGRRLEFKAFDLENRLFDHFTLEKD